MSKCEFYKKCSLYSKEGVTCNKDGGMWGDGYPGCYETLSKIKGRKTRISITELLFVLTAFFFTLFDFYQALRGHLNIVGSSFTTIFNILVLIILLKNEK